MSEGLSIIIPYWNGRRLAEANLPSVMEAAGQLKGDWEVIAVDDGSTDDLAELIHTRFPAVRLIQRQRNGGFSAAMRDGVAAARHALLYFLNSDVRVEAEAFSVLLRHFFDPKVCAVASFDARQQPFAVPVATNHWGLLGVRYLKAPLPQGPVSVLFATGGHSAYRADTFRTLGGYDELFAPAYWEDIDFGLRAHSRDLRILLDPASRVHHQPRGTMSRKYRARQMEALRASHRWWFTLRHSLNSGRRAWVALALSHGITACPPFSTGFREPTVESVAQASAPILRRFSPAVVRQSLGLGWRVAYWSATGSIVGGGEISLLTLLKALPRNAVEPVLVCPSEGTLTEQASGFGIEVKLFAMVPTLSGLLDGSIPRLARWLRDNEIDAVHVNSAGRSLLLPAMAARLLGIPVIWHVRVATAEAVPDALGVQLADRIIVTSGYVSGRLRSQAAVSKMVQIANPVDINSFNAALPKEAWRLQQGLSADDFCLGVVGRQDAWKRFDLALFAFAEARRQNNRLRLCLLGDGPQRKNLEALAAKLGVADSVVFAGWQADIPRALSAMDVIVHPTPGEHFGRIFIEAMACGKPVIASASGGAAELVLDGRTGVLIGNEEPAVWAQAVLALAADAPRRLQMGLAARSRAEVFDAPTVAGQVVRLYESLLGADERG